MDDIKKHAFLLSGVVLLLTLKFILVPIFEWQNNKLAEIHLIDKKNYKIDRMINHQVDNQSQHEMLSSVINKANAVFFPFESESSFKISQQKKLEILLKKYDLTMQNVGWQTFTVMEEIEAIRYPLELSLKGKSIDVFDFIVALEAQSPRFEIKELNLSVKSQHEEQLGYTDGRIILALYLSRAIEK